MTEQTDGWYIRLCTKLYDAIKSRYPNFRSFEFKQPAEKIFERGHPDLLARLARYCRQSYKWRPRSFAREMAHENVAKTFMFRRRAGALWWPGTLFWMPLS